MGDKNGRSSLDRIAELESPPNIYGSITSGAAANYMVKGDYSILSELTEGGFAKDIYFKKDTVQKRITIEETE